MRWGKVFGKASKRRPLIALVALVLALVIGYTVDALTSDHGSSKPSPSSPRPSVSVSVSPQR